jgi:hypothetical protein
MSNVVRITTNKVVDESGKVISETRQENVVSIRKMEEEPPYVKMYIEDLGRILGLQDGHRRVLMLVAGSVDYEGIVSLTIGRKARIAATLDCAIKSVDNAIIEFTKQGIIKRIGRGEYALDEHLFAKGKWRDIRERRASFKMTVNYSHKGRSISVERCTEAEEIAAEMEAEQKTLF